MTDTVVARRYAGALFSLGKKQGGDALNSYGACLSELGRLITETPQFEQLLKSPVIGIAEKKAVMASLLEKLSATPTMRNFCFLLADKERLGSLKEIASWYGIFLDEANGILRGRVTTAIKLTPEKQQSLKENLRKKTGRDMELTFTVDPEILGGLVLAVGDKVLDTSLRAQLGILGEILKRGM